MSAKWIWRGSDFELYFYHLMTKKRRERESVVYPVWAMDRPAYLAVFKTEYTADKDSEFCVFHTGKIAVRIGENPWFSESHKGKFFLPAGKGEVVIQCMEEQSFPTIFIDSDYLKTDGKWQVLQLGNVWTKVAFNGGFSSPDKSPLTFGFNNVKIFPVKKEIKHGGILYDFGRELVGTPMIKCKKKNEVSLYYGESEEEALDKENSEVINILSCETDKYSFPEESKGFRYIFVDTDESNVVDFFVEEEKYIPPFNSYFISDDKELNRIYEVSKYTLELTSREFFIDGIKRDRWVWVGDTLQSELFDFYSFFDTEIIKRTLRALIGSNPIKSNINTILDYNFYYFLAVYVYYHFTGDIDFIKETYPRLVSLMDYVFGKLHKNGLLQTENEWIFIDWTEIKGFSEINNSCPICLIQILYWASLKIMAEFSEMLGKDSSIYKKCAKQIKGKTVKTYFNKDVGFYHDTSSRLLTKYGNIAAILLKFADKHQKTVIKSASDERFEKINTPFMKFYENCMIAENGDVKKVLDYIKSYWGGMLKEGATSFWEQYNPLEKGKEKYAMYGRKYGKSLCHSWGAGPIYLLGKYVVGLSPLGVGYERYALKPYLKDLKFKSEIPVKDGSVRVEYDGKFLTIYSKEKDGVLFGNCFADTDLDFDKETGGYILKKDNPYKIMVKVEGENV